jgi:addiction module HigA family antidote
MKSLRDPKRKPTHPGAIIREDVLPALGITQGEFAAYLGVSRLTVSELVHEKRSLTAEMAVRLSIAIGGSPESWLHMQEALDIWMVKQKFKAHPQLKAKPVPFVKELLAA